MVKKSLLLCAVVGLAFVALITLHALYGMHLPRFSDATLSFEGVDNPPVIVSMPMWYTVGPLPPVANVRFTVELPKRHTKYFLLPHTANLVELTVNRQKLSPETVTEKPDFGGVLHAGSNEVTMRLFFSDPFSGLIVSFLSALRNGVTIAYALLHLLCVLFFSWLFYRLCGVSLRREVLFCIVLGIAVRSLYVSGTPWYFRGYDSQGHLDYILYLLQHKELPVGTDLWQGHQAPLYYVLAAFFLWIGTLFHWSKEVSVLAMQSFSLLLSLGTFLVGIRVVLSFFKGRAERFLAVLLLAVAPPLVFFSSQISNDVLLVFFGFLWYFALDRSVRDPGSPQWMWVSLWLGLSILTKANAMLLIVPTVLAFLFLTQTSFRDRVKRCGFLVLTSPLWLSFYLWRFLTDRSYGLVENAHLLSSAGHIDLTLQDFFIFNPFALFLQPFVHHVSGPFRPEYFFESVLRSFQFGSSVYESFGRYPLLFLLLLLPIGFFGIFSLLRKREIFPILTIVLLFAGLILFCLQYPYTSSQHFRYISVAVLPMILAVITGVYACTAKVPRIFSEVIIAVYALMTTLFYVGAFLSTW